MVNLVETVKESLVKLNQLGWVKFFLLLGVGLLVFYLLALSQYPAVHDALHDLRHAAGFPCH